MQSSPHLYYRFNMNGDMLFPDVGLGILFILVFFILFKIYRLKNPSRFVIIILPFVAVALIITLVVILYVLAFANIGMDRFVR